MASVFAPEFLILVGIDIFLGASILTVLLDRHFPTPLPYVLEGAALIGFAELASGPSFLTSLSAELQFWYSFIYAMISVLTLFATNLYLLFLRRRPFESAVLAICGTVPSGLGVLYFTSAFVNGLTVSLPLVPVVPIEGVYAMFGLSIALVVFSLVVFGRRARKVAEPAGEKRLEEPIIARGASAQQVVVTGEGGHTSSAQGSASVTPSMREPESLTPASADSNHASPSQSPGAVSEPAQARARPDGEEGLRAQKASRSEPPAVNSSAREGSPSLETVLVKKNEEPTYRQRLVDSMKFLEKAVDRPVKIDPNLVRSALLGAKSAYLTPGGTLMVEDSSGRTLSLSLMDLSTDEALKVMAAVMREIEGSASRGR